MKVGASYEATKEEVARTEGFISEVGENADSHQQVPRKEVDSWYDSLAADTFGSQRLLLASKNTFVNRLHRLRRWCERLSFMLQACSAIGLNSFRYLQFPCVIDQRPSHSGLY